MLPDSKMIKQASCCLCPQCGRGKIYKPGLLSFELRDRCGACGLNLAGNDSADGPAVFMIFILGFLLVPLALWIDAVLHWSLWLHALVWTSVSVGLTLGVLKPLKAYVIALQFKYRPDDWS